MRYTIPVVNLFLGFRATSSRDGLSYPWVNTEKLWNLLCKNE